MKNLASLLIEEQKILKEISENRKSSKKLLTNNRQLRQQLLDIRKEIVDDVVAEMNNNNKSLYQVVKESLGTIDSRYNKIYDLINKENLK
jgi:hypothetical protein